MTSFPGKGRDSRIPIKHLNPITRCRLTQKQLSAILPVPNIFRRRTRPPRIRRLNRIHIIAIRVRGTANAITHNAETGADSRVEEKIKKRLLVRSVEIHDQVRALEGPGDAEAVDDLLLSGGVHGDFCGGLAREEGGGEGGCFASEEQEGDGFEEAHLELWWRRWTTWWGRRRML
jgi:hypothetical protein